MSKDSKLCQKKYGQIRRRWLKYMISFVHWALIRVVDSLGCYWRSRVMRSVLRMKSMTVVKMHVIYHRQPRKYHRDHLWYMGQPSLLSAQHGGNCLEASALLFSHASIGSRRLRLSVHLP
jgi:hypothetical protein